MTPQKAITTKDENFAINWQWGERDRFYLSVGRFPHQLRLLHLQGCLHLPDIPLVLHLLRLEHFRLLHLHPQILHLQHLHLRLLEKNCTVEYYSYLSKKVGPLMGIAGQAHLYHCFIPINP